MFGRLLRVTGTVLVIAVAFVTPVLATSAPASADTVVNGCTVVSSPTPTNFTNCPGAFLFLDSLSGDDLSYANLSSAGLEGTNLSNTNLTSANLTGAVLVGCAFAIINGECFPANLTGANLTDLNLTDATLATCQTGGFFNETICGAVDLSGLDLSTVDLTNATLTNIDLTNANLSGVNLTGANLSGANLTGANLTGANLTGANLTGATLTGANLTGAILTGANLTGTLLAPPSETLAFATSFAGALVTWSTPQSLPGATPGSCTSPSGSTFPIGGTDVTCQILDDQGDVATATVFVGVIAFSTDTSLSASTNPSVLGQSVTYRATVSSNNPDAAPPSGGTVAFTDNGSPINGCSAVPLSSSGSAACSTTPDTPGTHSIGANFSGFILGGGGGVYTGSTGLGSTPGSLTQVVNSPPPPQFPCQKLAGCNLSGLNLSEANLASSDLVGTNLMGAELILANLSGADLHGANLMGANLSGANLSGVNLKGANLSNVTWSNTTCPDGTNSDSDGGTCIGHL